MIKNINENNYKRTLRTLEREKKDITKVLLESNLTLDLKNKIKDLNHCIAFVRKAYKEIKRLETQHKLF